MVPAWKTLSLLTNWIIEKVGGIPKGAIELIGGKAPVDWAKQIEDLKKGVGGHLGPNGLRRIGGSANDGGWDDLALGRSQSQGTFSAYALAGMGGTDPIKEKVEKHLGNANAKLDVMIKQNAEIIRHNAGGGCRSCMASSSADCTLAGARLISSASTRLAKMGPFLETNSLRLWL